MKILAEPRTMQEQADQWLLEALKVSTKFLIRKEVTYKQQPTTIYYMSVGAALLKDNAEVWGDGENANFDTYCASGEVDLFQFPE